MKKSIFTIFTLLILSAFANAQITIMPFVQGDFAHLVRFSNARYQEDFTPKLSYTFGISGNYAFSKKWELKSGLIFQDMGGQREINISFQPGNTFEYALQEIHYQFISIPIQMQYNFNSSRKITPFIAFGTSVNWNINSYIFGEGISNGEVVEEEKSDVKDITRTLNLGTNFSTGLQRKLTKKLNLNLFISGNILLLSTRISEFNFENARHFNIGLGIGLGYTILGQTHQN